MAGELLCVENFERNAAVCRWEAQIAGSQKHKSILLEIAKEWDAMAVAMRGDLEPGDATAVRSS